MKNLKILLLSLVMSLTTANAFANDNFYVGLEAQAKQYSFESDNDDFFEDQVITPTVFAGYNLPKGFAVELSYGQSSGSQSVTGDFDGVTSFNSDIDIKTIDLDVIKNFNITENTKVFGLVGLEYAKVDIKESFIDLGTPVSNSTSESGLGYSIGGGVSYDITSNITLRTKAKYTHLGIKTKESAALSEVENAISVGAGVLFKF